MGKMLLCMDAVTESPALGGSQTVVAASVASSVDDLILVMKVVIFFIVITTVGGSLSGIRGHLYLHPQILRIPFLLQHQQELRLQV